MRRTAVVALVAAGMMIALLGPVHAQESDSLPDPFEPVPRDEAVVSLPIDDGTYSGTVGLSGAFWMSESGVTMIWRGSASGPLELTVADGEMSGIWSTDGSAEINAHGLPFAVTGVNTWTMNGTVYGSDPYHMEGSGSGTTSVSGGGASSQGTYSIPTASAPLQGVMQVCGQVIGNWDQAIDASFEGVPVEHSIRSYFAVFSTDYETDFEAEVEQLLDQATGVQQRLSDEEPTVLLGELAVLLAEAEDLLGRLDQQPDACPPDPSFMRIITQVIQDAMHALLDRWSGEEPDYFQIRALQSLVGVGLRAGAIGAGAVDVGVADYLEARAGQVLQSQFDSVMAQHPIPEQDLYSIAVTAAMLGYSFDDGIDARSLCILLARC